MKTNTELEKLEAKRDEMRAEMDVLRARQVREPHVIKNIMRLSTMLCDCQKYIDTIRVSLVNKKTTTRF